ncbi:ribonuclease H-like domain-containing protein [Tanacetum coccineum]
MGDENPIRTLGDYSKPRHEGYKNTIELLVGNNVWTHLTLTVKIGKECVRNYEFLVPTGSTQFLLVVRFSLPGLLESPGLMEKQDLYICVAEEDMACTTSTPDNEAKLENERTINAKWKESSKNMDKLINSSMSSRSKFGLGFGETFGSDEVFDPSAPSIFDTTPEDVEGKPLYNRFVKTDRMKAVPPPLSGNYIPLSDPTDLDESQMTYGPKQTYTSDSEPKTIDLDSCESNSSVESLESMPKPVIIEPKTSEYASCKSNLSAKSPEFFPKSVCARNESVRKADNPRKNNKIPRVLPLPMIRVLKVENGFSPPWIIPFLGANGLTSPRVNGYLVDPFEHSRNWLERLPAGSITTWEDLTTRFLAQFFPPGRTAKLRNDILMFQQHHGESLSKA